MTPSSKSPRDKPLVPWDIILVPATWMMWRTMPAVLSIEGYLVVDKGELHKLCLSFVLLIFVIGLGYSEL